MKNPDDTIRPGSLYVVATPIGHLSDLGARAAGVLRAVDIVAAEDTRTTRVLLEHIGAHPQMLSAHRHNEIEAAQRIVGALAAGHSVALTSDAGTPAVSDPGARLVDRVRSAGYRIVPVPGPSAPIALISACGLVEGPFHFEGFLPAGAKARDERLAVLARQAVPFVLLEAPHRILATLDAIARLCTSSRRIAIGRELTKRFEEIGVCTVAEAPGWLQADANRQRGELVLVVGPEPAGERAKATGVSPGAQVTIDVAALMMELRQALPPAQAARIASRLTGLPREPLYALALAAPGKE